MGIDFLLILYSSYGGSQRMTLLYAKLLKKSGYNCHLLILQNSISKKFTIEPFIPKNLEYTLLSCRARVLPFKLYREIKKISPSIIFSSLSSLNNILLFLKTSHLLKSKLIVRLNTNPRRLTKSSLFFSKVFMRKSDIVISQTADMKNDIVKMMNVPEKKIVTILNPVDKEYIEQMIGEISPMYAEYVNYLAVGRINPIKDYVTLIKAFAKVKETNPKSRLYIVGDCDASYYEDNLHILVDSLELNDSVFFEGFQPNPYKYMKECSVFVLSSIMEGFPNVVLEALYIGKTVVVTDCVPILTKIVRSGEDGFVVPVGDSKSLASAMLSAISIVPHSRYDASQQELKVVSTFSSLLDKSN